MRKKMQLYLFWEKFNEFSFNIWLSTTDYLSWTLRSTDMEWDEAIKIKKEMN